MPGHRSSHLVVASETYGLALISVCPSVKYAFRVASPSHLISTGHGFRFALLSDSWAARSSKSTTMLMEALVPYHQDFATILSHHRTFGLLRIRTIAVNHTPPSTHSYRPDGFIVVRRIESYRGRSPVLPQCGHFLGLSIHQAPGKTIEHSRLLSVSATT